METIASAPTATGAAGPTLKDLLEDGIYLLFLMRNGQLPTEAGSFRQRLDALFAQFERQAQSHEKAPEGIRDAKYALCALADEIILAADSPVREAWEREPMQLRHFGEHLAGEGFFQRLENLRLDPVRHVEVLEVYHACLLLGFQGRYLLEGPEKLGYLITRVSQEISQVRGGRADFAPHALPSFRFQEFLRHELPLGAFYALLLLVSVAIFITYAMLLRGQTHRSTASTPAAATLHAG